MKKILHATACLLTVVLALASLTMPAFAGFNNETRDGVVYIEWFGPYIDDEGGLALGGWSGTGFFVGDGTAQYFVTNYHVASGLINVDQVVKDNFDLLDAYFKQQLGSDALAPYKYGTRSAKSLFPLHVVFGKNDFEEAYEVAYNKEKDLAVLRLDAPTDKRKPLTLRLMSEDFVGDSFYAVGYPAVADYVWETVQSYGKNDATVTTGTINRILTVSGTGMKVYQTDVKIRGGNSGGPLVDEQGNVVGINFQGTADWFDTNLNYAICVDELLPLLSNNNIPYQLAGGGNSAPDPDPDPNPAPTPPPAADTIDYWWVLLILIGGVGAWIGIARKRKPASAAPVSQPATPAASGASAYLICTKGNFAGTTFPVSGTLSIGRDPKRCQIVFPNDAKGISSLHCEVRQQPSGVTLTDKGSTYGTFLAGGRKLGANESVTLKSGDSFYLADNKNEFKVL